MKFQKEEFEILLNFIDFSETIKEIMENWDIIEMKHTYYYGYEHIHSKKAESKKIEKLQDETYKMTERQKIKKEIREKRKSVEVLEKKEEILRIKENIGDDIRAIYISEFDGDIYIKLNFNQSKISIPDVRGDSIDHLVLIEKNTTSNDDSEWYTELWYASGINNIILRGITGRPLKLKEWFDNYISKWVSFNKEIKSPPINNV